MLQTLVHSLIGIRELCSSADEGDSGRTTAYMLSGVKLPCMSLPTQASRQNVQTAMNGMYRSGELTSCRGGRYLWPPVICMSIRDLSLLAGQHLQQYLQTQSVCAAHEVCQIAGQPVM